MEDRNLSNTKLLEHYGVFNPPEGPRWKPFRCPFHEDKTASASSNGFGFICFACGVKGDPITLIKEREGIDYHSAVEFYEGITGEEFPKLRRAVAARRYRPSLSSEKADYERDDIFVSLGTSTRTVPRKRPRLHEG